MELRYNKGSVQQDSNKVVGLASIVYNGESGSEYNLGDNLYERFSAGAFDSYLKDQPTVYAFFNHDRSMLLGKTPDSLKLWTDERGLHYSFELDDTSYSKDLAILLRSGKVSGSSFAFQPTKVTWAKDGNKSIRQIESAVLHHVSPVVEPAYSSSEVALRERQQNVDLELMADYEKRLAEILDKVASK